ncbi:MAG: AsmA family protein [Candidatus Omnitrophica bacterium]|nr:AsmA family protein [Candidatus Omnitrophota bacterium]
MKKLYKIILLIFVVVVGLLFIKDQIIKTTVVRVGTKVLGAPIEMGGFSLSLFSQKVRISNLKVYNPEGFPKETLVDVPEIAVDYDLAAMLQGKVHLSLVVFNLKSMTVIRDKDGKLNVDALKVSQKADKPAEKEPAEKKELDMQIDILKLNIGQVVYKDYSKGEPPTVQSYDVNLRDKVFKNITSPEQLVLLIMTQSLSQTAIKGAKIYAAASILGVGFLPAGIAGALLGEDHASEKFRSSFDKVFNQSLAVIKKIGELKSEDKFQGIIKAKVDGCDVAIKIEPPLDGNVRVVVSARKMLLPKPQVAGGVLYQISQELK